MADMPGACPFCGKDTGDNKFCPHCGGVMPRPAAPPALDFVPPAEETPPAQGTVPVLPAPVLGNAPVVRGAGAPPEKKNYMLVVALAALALLVVAGVVVAVVLLSGGGGVTMSIKSPENGSTTTGGTVNVELEISEPSRVAKVEVFLDSEKRATIESSPFTTELVSLEKGNHEVKATAYDSSGAVLAEATSAFESEGGPDESDGGDKTDNGNAAQYKSALAQKVNQARLLDAQITDMANRINSQVNFNTRTVPAGLLADVRALDGSAGSLVAAADALRPPADMKDLQARFASLVSYLQVRADSLLKGLEAVTSDGDYKSAFDKGGAAKASFDKAWPGFVSDCKSRGVPI